ncbi:unnamed protein product [Chilo suppressalis]|nr:unnamed protein product [Chilo suppressalis]
MVIAIKPISIFCIYFRFFNINIIGIFKFNIAIKISILSVSWYKVAIGNPVALFFDKFFFGEWRCWIELAKMVNNRVPSVFSKTYVTPRRPFEKARLDQELKIIGEYGLRNKREVWRVKYTLARIRKAARELLTLEEKDPKRLFEGNALLRRLVRIGVLDEKQMKLDYVLGLKIEDFLERRLQTQVFKAGLAKSIHHARILIRQRHIRVRKQVVNIPSFIVRLDSGKHIDFSLKSPFGGGRPGRVKRKNLRKGQAGGATNDEEED